MDSYDSSQSSDNIIIDYQRVFRTMWPLDSNWLSLIPPLHHSVSRIFENVKPEYCYSYDIIESVSELPPIQIGQKLDAVKVKSLLSIELARKDSGERVELGKAIEGKYTMICCFHAPILGTEENSILVQSLVNTCSQLYADQGTSFEMVVVVKMKKLLLADFKPVFDCFLSGFPSSCLVIPFEDPKHRDLICNYLKLKLDDVQCLLLDDNSNVLLHGYPSFAWSYGAEAFPFSEQKMETLKAEQWDLDGSCITSDGLLSLLRCNPSDVLKKTNAEGGCEMTITMSDLIKNDVVGVYLCAEGDLIPKLKEVYEVCKIQHKGFEVLLVYDPFKTCLDPQNYKVCVDKMLQEHNLSLWYIPFDNSVSHKLSGRTSDIHSLIDDQLIMFRRNEQSSSYCVDTRGAHMIWQCGIDAYPFNRREIVARQVNRVSELTLEKLLGTFVLKNNQQFPVAGLIGMNVLVWIGSLSLSSEPNLRFFEALFIWYKYTKKKNQDFEVVLVLCDKLDLPEDISSDSVISERLPWMVCPFDAKHSAFVSEELLFNDFVEFGKDGRVSTLRGDKKLVYTDVDECGGTIPFSSKGKGEDRLYWDVIASYCEHYSVSMS